jgi:predicted DNA-binding ribbon-helix-helix protein
MNGVPGVKITSPVGTIGMRLRLITDTGSIMVQQHYRPAREVILRYGQRTSLRLEHEFWHALRFVALAQQMSMAELIRTVEAQPRPEPQSFASALRCYVIRTLLALVSDQQ